MTEGRKHAGFWVRFWAVWIDALCLGLLVGFIYHTAAAFDLLSYDTRYDSLGVFFFDVILPAALVILLWVNWSGRTPGKYLLNLRVVTYPGYGGELSAGRAIGRYLSYFLSVFTLFVGYIMAGARKDKRALHDITAGTCVIYEPKEHNLIIPMRIAARTADYYIYTFIYLGILIFSGHTSISEILDINIYSAEGLISSVLLIAGGIIILDALCVYAFGTSLGRKLFSLRVEKRNGQKLSLSQSLKRSVTSVILGWGCYISPAVSCVTSFCGYILYYRRNGHTPWDRNGEYRVTRTGNPGKFRKILCAFFILSLMSGAVILVDSLRIAYENGGEVSIRDLHRYDRELEWGNYHYLDDLILSEEGWE